MFSGWLPLDLCKLGTTFSGSRLRRRRCSVPEAGCLPELVLVESTFLTVTC